MTRHPCLVEACLEDVPGGYLTCSRHWALVPPEMRKEIRGASGAEEVAVYLVRLLADLHSRVELLAVPPPPDHDAAAGGGFLAACRCRSCSWALEAALGCRGLAQLSWVRSTWERLFGREKSAGGRADA